METDWNCWQCYWDEALKKLISHHCDSNFKQDEHNHPTNYREKPSRLILCGSILMGPPTLIIKRKNEKVIRLMEDESHFMNILYIKCNLYNHKF